MVAFEGQVPVKEVLKKFTVDDYLVKAGEDGEGIVEKPDGTQYKVSLTGVNYPIGCTCRGGEFELDRQKKFPNRTEYENACKHKKLIMATCKCPKCEARMELHEFIHVVDGEEVEGRSRFFRCGDCEFITDANEIANVRLSKRIASEAGDLF